jgi:hypothetical protein
VAERAREAVEIERLHGEIGGDVIGLAAAAFVQTESAGEGVFRQLARRFRQRPIVAVALEIAGDGERKFGRGG